MRASRLDSAGDDAQATGKRQIPPRLLRILSVARSTRHSVTASSTERSKPRLEEFARASRHKIERKSVQVRVVKEEVCSVDVLEQLVADRLSEHESP